MNWTEGILASHSRGRKGKEITLRQKEHFAKARTGLLNAKVKISPPSISFFAHSAHASSPVHHRSIEYNVNSSKKRIRENSALQTSHYFENDDLGLLSPASFLRGQAEEEALRQKRQKLLLKGDWVGTDVQKPIQMQFSKPRASVDGPWGGSRSHRQSSRQRLRHRLGIRAFHGQHRATEPLIRFSTPVTRSQLRVQVGSRERALGDSSNASPRDRNHRDTDSDSHVARSQGIKHDKEPDRNADHDKSSSVCSHSHAYSHTHPSSEDSGGSFLQTKSPHLVHPVPRRPALQQLLRSQSSDSDNATSTRALVGMRRPDVPSSQVLENEAWRQFVVAADDGQTMSDSGAFHSQGFSSERPISPGISQIGQPTQLSHARKRATMLSADSEIENRNSTDQVLPVQMHAQLLRSDDPNVTSTSEDEQDSTSTALDASGASRGSRLVQADRSLGSVDGTSCREATDPSEDSDEVDLLVVPASSSCPSESNLDRSDILPIPHAPEVDREETTSPTQQAEQRPAEEPAGPAKPKEEKPLTSSTLEDENDMWRKFILDEADDYQEEALEEARKETARYLRPSDTSTSTVEEEDSSEEVDAYAELAEAPVASSNGFDADVRDAALQHDFALQDTQPFADINDASLSSGIDMRGYSLQYDEFSGDISVASVSHRATAGDSSPNRILEASPPFSDTTAQTGRATTGSLGSMSSSTRPFADLANEFSRRSDTWSFVTQEADNASLIVHPSSLRERENNDDNFKFARPQTFLGKTAKHLDEQRQIALSAPQIRAKTRTWRRQRRTGDGRTSIRKLPDFSSDPIEEVDDIPAKRAQKPSLFGSLDTQEGY